MPKPSPEIPSTKPYLLRALYEWCVDHGFTPYLAVSVDAYTQVPKEFVQDGQIVLNIGVNATGRLNIGNDAVTLSARFGGVARELYIPIGRVSALYARENGAGMGFEVEETPVEGDTADSSESTPPESPPERPKLQRIK